MNWLPLLLKRFIRRTAFSILRCTRATGCCFFRNDHAKGRFRKDHSHCNQLGRGKPPESRKKNLTSASEKEGVGTMSEAGVLGSPAGRAYEPTVTRIKTVRVITEVIQPLSGIPGLSARSRRVAAYARFSTSSEEQLTSYGAQVKHYTDISIPKKLQTTGSSWMCIQTRTLRA